MSGVEPAVGFVGEDTVIQISGANFYPLVDIDATGAATDVDGEFTVALVDPVGDDGAPLRFPLPGALLLDYEHLSAVVPAGLPALTYDVVVSGPSGASGGLTNGYTVSQTQADHLSVASAQIVYEVREEAQIAITLETRAGARVLADQEIVVYVEAVDGEVEPIFSPGSLEDQTPLGPTAIQGRLGVDGSATIGLTTASPEQVTVTATPTDTESVVADGQVVLLYEPGSDLSARIELPSENFRATAGTPFPVTVVLVDQFGNDAPDGAASLVLSSSCSSWVEVVDVIGRATVSAELFTATVPGSSCEEERISVVGGLSGSSEPLQVLPGPASRFDVVATPSTVTAGESSLQVVATPTDAWGNDAAWSGSPVLTDSVGGLAGFDCVVDGLVVCTAQPLIAGADIELTVDGGDGVVGVSDPYTVLPGAPVSLSVKVIDDPVVADTPAAVQVRVHDVFSNELDGGGFAPDAFAISANGSRISCTPLVSPDLAAIYGCPLRTADSAVVLSVELVGFGLSGVAQSVAVINGALTDVALSPQQGVIPAGQDLAVDLMGHDAWGNPFIVGTDRTVDVADNLGGFSPTSVVLDGAGAAQVVVQPSVAGAMQIEASQGGVVLGSSTVVTVTPAAPTSLSIVLVDPWAWVGTPVDVAVRALDAFGNVADESGVVTVSSASGSAASTPISLVDGLGAGTLTWSSPHFDEQVDAAGLGLAGTVQGYLVVEDCGGSGPSAALEFATGHDGVCAVDQSGVAELSLASSAAGSRPLSTFAVRSERGAVIGGTSLVSIDLFDWGAHALVGLAAADDGCASEAAVTAWLGPDDGSPVGALMLSANLATVEAGVEQTTVQLSGALTCGGLAADGAAVRVRADRGAILGASALGTGLHTTIDAAGEGTFIADLSTAVEGPELLVSADVASGAARGSTVVGVSGDLQSPVVWDMSPRGLTAGSVDTLHLTLSEPIDEATVLTAHFDLVGPSSARVQFARLLADGRTIELSLQSAVDAGAGLWTLTLDPAVADLAGNGLDGLAQGSVSAFVGVFGPSTVEAPAVSSCGPSTVAFRPDGDDGLAEEADQVVFSVQAAAEPTLWRLSVFDATARLVRRSSFTPTGAVEDLVWDGRDQSGAVVEDGAWTIEIDAEDADGNVGASCSQSVSVANREDG
ncbi:MAG: hypothetical protein KC912_01385 [Proteobacteria bacterium]|nr:hypothetical protein [Pseudomonadota bacterium]